MKALFSWRRLRKAANETFSRSSVKGFNETQMKEAILLASDMLVGPTRWDQHFRRAAASTTLSALYGYPTVRSEQDHVVRAINDFGERLFRATFMGAHLVQFLPWLRHLPSRRVPPMRHHQSRLIEKLSKKLGEMEARRRGLVRARYCDVRRSFTNGGGKSGMNVFHAPVSNRHLHCLFRIGKRR